MKPTAPAAIPDILSKKTVKRLKTALTKENSSLLEKCMVRLFGYTEVYNLHADHLLELAECIIDLVSAEDPLTCAREMDAYIGHWKQKYHKEQNELMEKYQWAKRKCGEDPLRLLDLQYQCDVYWKGFAYSRFHEYTLLGRLTRFIQERGGL